MTINTQDHDPRTAQAERVADYLEALSCLPFFVFQGSMVSIET